MESIQKPPNETHPEKQQILAMADIALKAETQTPQGISRDYTIFSTEQILKYGCGRLNAMIALYNAGYRQADDYVSKDMYDLAKAFHDEKCAEFDKLCHDYHKLQAATVQLETQIAKRLADPEN